MHFPQETRSPRYAAHTEGFGRPPLGVHVSISKTQPPAKSVAHRRIKRPSRPGPAPLAEQFAAAANAERPVDRLDVNVNGMAADPQFPRDLFFRVSFQKQTQNLSRSGRQTPVQIQTAISVPRSLQGHHPFPFKHEGIMPGVSDSPLSSPRDIIPEIQRPSAFARPESRRERFEA